MNKKTPDPTRLAIGFSDALANLLDAPTIAEINRLNATAEYQGICATHDFCDPNQVMADVLETFGFDYHQQLNDVINMAWESAKNWDSRQPKLSSGKTVKLATIKREFLSLYASDLTHVVVKDNGSTAVIKPLNFPERQPTEVPWEHLNVFDELPVEPDLN